MRVPRTAAALLALLGIVVAGLVLLGRQHSRDDREAVVLPLRPPDAGSLTPAAEREISRRLDDLTREVGELRAMVGALTRERADIVGAGGVTIPPLVSREPGEKPMAVTLGVSAQPATPAGAGR